MRGHAWLLLAGAGAAFAGALWLLVGLQADAHALSLTLTQLPYELALAYALDFSDERLPYSLWCDLGNRTVAVGALLAVAGLLLGRGLRALRARARAVMLQEWEATQES